MLTGLICDHLFGTATHLEHNLVLPSGLHVHFCPDCLPARDPIAPYVGQGTSGKALTAPARDHNDPENGWMEEDEF